MFLQISIKQYALSVKNDSDTYIENYLKDNLKHIPKFDQKNSEQ